MRNIDDVIKILERKTTVPEDSESFEDISDAFDSAVAYLNATKHIISDIRAEKDFNKETGLYIAMGIIQKYVDVDEIIIEKK